MQEKYREKKFLTKKVSFPIIPSNFNTHRQWWEQVPVCTSTQKAAGWWEARGKQIANTSLSFIPNGKPVSRQVWDFPSRLWRIGRTLSRRGISDSLFSAYQLDSDVPAKALQRERMANEGGNTGVCLVLFKDGAFLFAKTVVWNKLKMLRKQ